MNGVPKRAIAILKSGKFCPMTSQVISAKTSKDGTTTKLLVQLQVLFKEKKKYIYIYLYIICWDLLS